MFERYNIVSPANLEEAARSLSQFHATGTNADTIGDAGPRTVT